MNADPRVAVIDTQLCEAANVLRSAGFGLNARQDSLVCANVKETCSCNPHGTVCAAIIASIAPQAQIVSIPVLDYEGLTSTEVLAEGIVQALSIGVDLVNVSVGANSMRGLRSLASACKQAERRGVPIVAALGPTTQSASPAVLAGCIAVEASDSAGELMLSQPIRPFADIGACGAYRFRCPRVDHEAHRSGSSYATATVTGWLAALLSRGAWRRSSRMREVLGALYALTDDAPRAQSILTMDSRARRESSLARLIVLDSRTTESLSLDSPHSY
jgi:hypothetical protein